MKTPERGLVSEMALYAYRISALIIVTGFTIYKIQREGTEFFYFLTNWNWIFLILYFGIAVYQSYTLVHGSGRIDRLHRITFSLIQSLSWVVTITYWVMLAGDVFSSPTNTLELKITSGIAHALNLIVVLIDLFLSRVQLAWKDVMYPIITALVYQIMVVVWKVVASRFWPYKFVATINGGQDKLNWAAIFGFAAGLSVVILIFHGITIGLIAIRNLMLPKEKKSTAAASQDTIVEVV